MLRISKEVTFKVDLQTDIVTQSYLATEMIHLVVAFSRNDYGACIHLLDQNTGTQEEKQLKKMDSRMNTKNAGANLKIENDVIMRKKNY